MLMEKRPTSGVYGYSRDDLTFREGDKKGMALAAVRASREEGKYLGYLRIDRMTETGLHQHLGPAASYFLSGGFTDYQGTASAGELGINLAGATHSAMAYADTLTVSRLEAPVIYPEENRPGHRPLHTGARAGAIVNEDPDVMPDINLQVDGVPMRRSDIARVSRRTVFDYAGTGEARRCVHMQLLPYSEIPAFTTTGALDIFVIGGALRARHEEVSAGGFIVIDEGTTTDLRTEFGALIMAWSEGPVVWQNASFADPFGF